MSKEVIEKADEEEAEEAMEAAGIEVGIAEVEDEAEEIGTRIVGQMREPKLANARKLNDLKLQLSSLKIRSCSQRKTKQIS